MFSGDWKRDVLIGLASAAVMAAVLAVAGFFMLGPFGAPREGALIGAVFGLAIAALMWWMTWRLDNDE